MTQKEQIECAAEAKVLASLHSPCIIQYLDSFIEQDVLYIVTEFASGGTLYSLINQAKGPLPEDVIWRLFIQIILGLHHMHEKRILHRDIKSQNIFIAMQSGRWQAKIGDLGVARHMSSHTCFAKTVVGTPYYLSPELCEDRPYNQKSDVWASGIVLYESCTGKHPFDGQSQAALIMKILRGQYRPIVGYSADLTDIVKRCLTQSTARRPDTARLLGLPSVQSRAQAMGIALPEGIIQTSRRTSRPGSPALSPDNSPLTSPAGSLQLEGRPIYRDDTPLSPPANLAAIQQQRQLRLNGAQMPGPRLRGRDQLLNQHARNNAFVLPPAVTAARQLQAPRGEQPCAKPFRNALSGNHLKSQPGGKKAALDILRQRSLRRRSFSVSKHADCEAGARPQSAGSLGPIRLPEGISRQSEDGACTPTQSSDHPPDLFPPSRHASQGRHTASNDVGAEAQSDLSTPLAIPGTDTESNGAHAVQPSGKHGSATEELRSNHTIGGAKMQTLRARIAVARQRCKELIGENAFEQAHSSLQAQAHGVSEETLQEVSSSQLSPLLTSGPSLSQLPLAPGDFEALHMLYKLMYLEGQLEQMGLQSCATNAQQLDITLAL
ncbi:hypothetical protein WJX74_001940 [Apatococcus lobatus]|uniref:non-specific serine/threonine protein kinase n=1 Tax=Apatococcus lobatus TaxID=904363 RepID=A0AAW1RSF2_9CHLO